MPRRSHAREFIAGTAVGLASGRELALAIVDRERCAATAAATAGVGTS